MLSSPNDVSRRPQLDIPDQKLYSFESRAGEWVPTAEQNMFMEDAGADFPTIGGLDDHILLRTGSAPINFLSAPRRSTKLADRPRAYRVPDHWQS